MDRAEVGDPAIITRDSIPVAQITAIKPPSKRIDAAVMLALTENMPFQEEAAGDFIRPMPDEDRY